MTMFLDDGRYVHYPFNPDRFEFDEDVSRIFPDMAIRSIPMYSEVHRMHVSMLRSVFEQEQVSVLDVGASRGGFFREVCNQFQVPPKTGRKGWDFIAVDSSIEMLRLLHVEMPWVATFNSFAQSLPVLTDKADVICLFYVLQFIEHDDEKIQVLSWAAESLKPGGILLLGQKDVVAPGYEERFREEYFRFRRRNGYTQEEIDAKTAALKNAMWPSSPAWLHDMCLLAGFADYMETSRWLQFSTSMCVKGG